MKTQAGNESLNFIVNPEMLTPLRTLGLIKKIGDVVVFSELKRAYLKRSKETHPDKTGDTGVAFVAVTKAYEALISIVEQELPAGGERYAESEGSLIAKMNELKVQMQRESQIWRSIAERARCQNEQLEKQTDVIRGLTSDFAESKRRLDTLERRLGLPPYTDLSVTQVGALDISASSSNPHRLFLGPDLGEKRQDDSDLHPHPSDTLH
jgi:hypothetical protein